MNEVKVIKNDRIAIRTNRAVKQALQKLAKKQRSDVSKIIHDLIVRELQEANISISETVKIV